MSVSQFDVEIGRNLVSPFVETAKNNNMCRSQIHYEGRKEVMQLLMFM